MKNMKIVFISNFMTEHQKFLSMAFCSHKDIDYRFIETKEPDDSFQSVNCNDDKDLDFVIGFDEFKAKRKDCCKIINDADVVIHGSAPDSLISERVMANKLTFRYSERFYKDGFLKIKYMRNYLAAWLHHGRFKDYKLYMLCSSAFTSADANKFGNYIGKCYKWGYFPRTETFDITKAVEEKKPGSIIWASRFIDWKHPEIPVLIAERLKNDGYDFSLTLYGKGKMFDTVGKLIKDKNLEDKVFLDDSKNSDELREIMRASSIFLHTANRKEGWGVVVNEAMNSGCAVVASHIVGAVPYMIKDGENGMIYEDGNIDDLYKKITGLLSDPAKTKRLGINAYETVTKLWNAGQAADRFYALSKAMLSGDKNPILFDDGPCSKAQIIEDDWYKTDRDQIR